LGYGADHQIPPLQHLSEAGCLQPDRSKPLGTPTRASSKGGRNRAREGLMKAQRASWVELHLARMGLVVGCIGLLAMACCAIATARYHYVETPVFVSALWFLRDQAKPALPKKLHNREPVDRNLPASYD